nr:nicotinate (nicotinamide) nucleotide adenylyltransferase [Alteromonas ponticola]
MGGTFNPPHFGHIEPALAAIDSIGADKLGLMPCKVPPHKSLKEANETHRIEMTRLACQVDRRMYVELCELSMPAPSYSVKTLQALRQNHPDKTIFFLMGEDSFYQLSSWYNWQALTDFCHLVVMRREMNNTVLPAQQTAWMSPRKAEIHPKTLRALAGNIFFVETPYYSVSSTQIRQAVADYVTADSAAATHIEQQIIKWLPEPVFNYIKANRLYHSVTS